MRNQRSSAPPAGGGADVGFTVSTGDPGIVLLRDSSPPARGAGPDGGRSGGAPPSCFGHGHVNAWARFRSPERPGSPPPAHAAASHTPAVTGGPRSSRGGRRPQTAAYRPPPTDGRLQAAGDPQHGPRGVGGLRGQQPRDGAGDLVRLA